MTISGIIDTPVASTVNSTTTTSTSTTSVSDDQDKFMKLLVTQLQNQDPLNPMDNSEMTSQLAQLSTVTGINTLNSSLTALQTSLDSSNALTSATSMIGKGVLVAGSGIELSSSTTTADDGTTSTSSGAVFGFDLASAAANVTVSIQDSTGATVRTMSLTNAEIGAYPISWDGTTDSGTTAAAGSYTFTVTASNAGSTLTDVTPLQLAAVASVSSGSGGVKLNTSLGQFTLSEIKQVL